MRLIINADDCGSNREIDMAISRFIEMRKITSTTVIANMSDDLLLNFRRNLLISNILNT